MTKLLRVERKETPRFKTYIYQITNIETGRKDTVPAWAKDASQAYHAVFDIYGRDYMVSLSPAEVRPSKFGTGIYCD